MCAEILFRAELLLQFRRNTVIQRYQHYRVSVLHTILPVREHSYCFVRQCILFGKARQGISGRLQLSSGSLLRYCNQAFAALHGIHTGEPPAEIADPAGERLGAVSNSYTGGIEEMQPVVRRIVHIADLIIVNSRLQIPLQGQRIAVLLQKALRRINADDLFPVVLK
ncbi:hypothetical protein D3C75_829870 [compost metagenome]